MHEDTHKYYFTLIDFRGVSSHFADPEFDGEPVQIYEPKEGEPIDPPVASPTDEDGAPLPETPDETETIVDGADLVLPDGSLFGEGVKTRLKEHLLEECNLHTIVRLPNSVFRPYASIGTNLLFFEKGAPTQHIWFWEHRVPEGQKAYSMTRPIRLEHLADCATWWGGLRREGRQETERAWKVCAEEVKARGYNLDMKNPHAVAEDRGDPERLLEDLTAAEAEVAAVRDHLKAILFEALAR